MVFRSHQAGALVFKNKDQTGVRECPQKEPYSEGSEPHSEVAATNSERIFTFEDITYEVPYKDGFRRLLNGITGYVKSGNMVALIGSSGAGKTTLLNTLAQRQKTGILTGEMLVNGLSLPFDFKRMAGFCEQMDLHDESATVLEAFEFSALLRQTRNVSTPKKLRYARRILNLLELESIQNALISSLSVEQKKRVTIGVELGLSFDQLFRLVIEKY